MNFRATTSYTLLIVLIFVPAAFGFLYVYLFGVNVLVRNEWFMAILIGEQFSGTLTISDFWAQHNEHRLFLVKIVLLVLATITHLNVKTEMYVTQTAFLITLIIFFLAFYDSTRAGKRAKLLLFVPISFLVFSPRQGDTWLLGVLVQFALVIMFSVLTLYLLRLLARGASGYGVFGAALTSATAATLSSSQGLLVWPVGLLQLLLIPIEKPAKKVVVGVWSLVGVAEWVVYFLDWTRRPNSGNTPSLLYALAHPLEGVRFFLTVLGSSLFWQEGFAIAGGLVIAALIAVTLFLVYRNRAVADQSFWVALILFSLATLAAVTAARVGLGAQGALTPRHASFSLLAVIGVYAMLVKLAIELRSFIGAVLVGILSVLLLVGLPISYLKGIEAGQGRLENREHAAYILSTWEDQPDEALKLVYPNPADLRAGQEPRILERHDYNVFYEEHPQASLPPLSELSPAGAATESHVQTINDIRVGGEERAVAIPQKARFVTVRGWAVDARAKEAAGGVYLDVDGELFPAYYGLEREDVAQAFEEEAYHYTGFEGSIRASRIGEGRHTLSIVVLSSDRERYYRPHQRVDLEIK
jgi:hypothetical protein